MVKWSIFVLSFLHEEDFPVDAEALLVHGREVGARPKIILQFDLSPNRKTFTLAHELGHLLIPWHTGDFVCKPSDINSDDLDAFVRDMNYREIEAQANRFAAEFLMPSDVFFDTCSAGGFDAIRQYAKQGAISMHAALLKLINIVPPGHIFIYAESGRVKYARRSKDTFVDPPDPASGIDFTYYLEMGGKLDYFNISGGEAFWIDLSEPQTAKDLSNRDFASWRVVLDEILNDLGYDDGVAEQQKSSISGIFGAAISKVKHMEGADYFSVVKLKFQQYRHQYVVEIVEHELFDTFIDMRCAEVVKRHKN